jgi:CoA-transferase family III
MKLLDGIRVLDLTNVLAGPYASYQLALMGADVIKVEVPGSGDLARQLGADASLSRQQLGASFVAQNAGKRSITVNLKSGAGRMVFERLVLAADVLVEKRHVGPNCAPSSKRRSPRGRPGNGNRSSTTPVSRPGWCSVSPTPLNSSRSRNDR